MIGVIGNFALAGANIDSTLTYHAHGILGFWIYNQATSKVFELA